MTRTELEHKYKELDGENLKLSLDVSFASDEVVALKDGITKVTHERDEISNQLGELQEENSRLSANLQNGFTDLEQERDQLRSRISESESDRNRAVVNLEAERNTLQMAIIGLNERIVKLESEKASVQQQLDKACDEGRQVLLERNIEINHRTTVLEPYGRCLQAEIAQLKAEATPENLDKLRQEVGELTSLNTNLEKERDNVSKALEAYKMREERIAEKEKEFRLAKNQADILRQKLEQVGGYQNKAKEAERVAATLHQENKELQKEVNDMRRMSQPSTPATKGGERYRRLQDQFSQLKAENEALKTKVQKLDQASSKDDDGDEGMNDAAGAGGKRPGDGQHRHKLAPKTRASKKDLVADRLSELEGLINKWKAQQAVKRDLSKEPSLRDRPIVDEADIQRLRNIIDSVSQPLQLAMTDAGRRDARRVGWQKASRWLAMHLRVITDHEEVEGILVDVEAIEGIAALNDRDLSMLASNMKANLTMTVMDGDGDGDGDGEEEGMGAD